MDKGINMCLACYANRFRLDLQVMEAIEASPLLSNELIGRIAEL